MSLYPAVAVVLDGFGAANGTRSGVTEPPVFRDRVLLAYSLQCALCRLRHPELLDAAHINEDSDGGKPVVPNGVAMCAIHHRSFDKNVLTVRPDYLIDRSAADPPTARARLRRPVGPLGRRRARSG